MLLAVSLPHKFTVSPFPTGRTNFGFCVLTCMGNGSCLICPCEHTERLPVYMVQHGTVQQPLGMKSYHNNVQIKMNQNSKQK